jgi:hypothetical protein
MSQYTFHCKYFGFLGNETKGSGRPRIKYAYISERVHSTVDDSLPNTYEDYRSFLWIMKLLLT